MVKVEYNDSSDIIFPPNYLLLLMYDVRTHNRNKKLYSFIIKLMVINARVISRICVMQ